MNGNRDWRAVLRDRHLESDRNWWLALILSATFGWAGADRFYLHQFILGSLKLVTFGGMFVWWAFDLLLLLAGRMADGDGLKLAPPWRGGPGGSCAPPGG